MLVFRLCWFLFPNCITFKLEKVFLFWSVPSHSLSKNISCNCRLVSTYSLLTWLIPLHSTSGGQDIQYNGTRISQYDSDVAVAQAWGTAVTRVSAKMKVPFCKPDTSAKCVITSEQSGQNSHHLPALSQRHTLTFEPEYIMTNRLGQTNDRDHTCIMILSILFVSSVKSSTQQRTNKSKVTQSFFEAA